MSPRTPLMLITGPLGSGKTTLLRHILDTVSKKMAIFMNEFGEVAIDSKVIEGKNVRITELPGGCVCCSLLGEFEAAVGEVIEKIHPETIVVETTGLAEPEALIFDIGERLPGVRLDGVVTVADADAMVRYPQLGHTTRMQIEGGDLILLNKIDLVSPEDLAKVKQTLSQLNKTAAVIATRRCQVDPGLLLGIGREREADLPQHKHQPEFESFSYRTEATLERSSFEAFADRLSNAVYRAKGFVRLREGTFLFNSVAGRWELEPFAQEKTALVFIGKGLKQHKDKIIKELKECEQ